MCSLFKLKIIINTLVFIIFIILPFNSGYSVIILHSNYSNESDIIIPGQIEDESFCNFPYTGNFQFQPQENSTEMCFSVDDLYQEAVIQSADLSKRIKFYQDRINEFNFSDELENNFYNSSILPVKLIEANKEMLDAIGWIDADIYFNKKYDKLVNEVNTLIIEFDTGVDSEGYSELVDYIFPGWDVIEADSIPVDDENTMFRNQHGTQGIEMLATLSPKSKIIPIRIAKSSDWEVTLCNLQLGIEKALSIIERIEKVTGKDYNVVANIPVSFWLNSFMEDELNAYWQEENNGERLFSSFKEEKKGQIEILGFDPESLEYNDVIEDGNLSDLANEWLFNMLYVEDDGIWSLFSTMEEEEWKIIVPGTNFNFGEKVYPAARKEIEGVGRISYEGGYGYRYYSYENWAELVAPDKFKVYNFKEDNFFSAKGSCVSSFMVTALYSKLWDIAPNLNRNELDEIVKESADFLRPGYSQRLIDPYSAIRTAWVYGKIKHYVSEYENNSITFDKLKCSVEEVLKDTEDENFYTVNAMEDIILSDTNEIKSLEEILDCIICKSEELEYVEENSKYVDIDYLNLVNSNNIYLQYKFYDIKMCEELGYVELSETERKALNETTKVLLEIDEKMVKLTQLMREAHKLEKRDSIKEDETVSPVGRYINIYERNLLGDGNNENDKVLLDEVASVTGEVDLLKDRYEKFLQNKVDNGEESDVLLNDIKNLQSGIVVLRDTPGIIYHISLYNTLSSEIEYLEKLKSRVLAFQSDERKSDILEVANSNDLSFIEDNNSLKFAEKLKNFEGNINDFLEELKKYRVRLERKRRGIINKIESEEKIYAFRLEQYFNCKEKLDNCNKTIAEFEVTAEYLDIIREKDLENFTDGQKENLIAVFSELDKFIQLWKEKENHIYNDPPSVFAEDITTVVNFLGKIYEDIGTEELVDNGSEEKTIESSHTRSVDSTVSEANNLTSDVARIEIETDNDKKIDDISFPFYSLDSVDIISIDENLGRKPIAVRNNSNGLDDSHSRNFSLIRIGMDNKESFASSDFKLDTMEKTDSIGVGLWGVNINRNSSEYVEDISNEDVSADRIFLIDSDNNNRHIEVEQTDDLTTLSISTTGDKIREDRTFTLSDTESYAELDIEDSTKERTNFNENEIVDSSPGIFSPEVNRMKESLMSLMMTSLTGAGIIDGGENQEEMNTVFYDGIERKDSTLSMVSFADFQQGTKIMEKVLAQDLSEIIFATRSDLAGMMDISSSLLCEELNKGNLSLINLTEAEAGNILNLLHGAEETGLPTLLASFWVISLFTEGQYGKRNVYSNNDAGDVIANIIQTFNDPQVKGDMNTVLTSGKDLDSLVNLIKNISESAHVDPRFLIRLSTAKRREVAGILKLAGNRMNGNRKSVLFQIATFLNETEDKKGLAELKLPVLDERFMELKNEIEYQKERQKVKGGLYSL